MGLLIAGLLAGAAAWWLNQPLALSSETVDLSIEPGTSPRGVAQAAAEAGVDVNPTLLFWWFRLSGDARQIRAGSYELARGATPRTLLQMLVRGEESLRSVTLVEGWNWRQVRQALSRAEQLKPDTENLSDEMIMSQLGRAGLPAEGRFFPDTYTYAKGSSDLAVLRRALHAMDRKLDAAWAQRAPDTPLKTPTEALILASIVEKETGKPADRAMISGVFVNRLRIGMMLQTDPTVIYGLGEAFDGNLRKRHLQADTAVEHLHPRRPAAHPHRHAGQGFVAGGGATGADQSLVLRGTRRWQQPVQRHAGRTQSRGQQVPAWTMTP